MLRLRYVILWHHQIKEPHFDLMFETYPDSPLATWRSRIWPIESRTEVIRLKDHRREYLDYEGELTERRGHVTRAATGACRLEIGEDAVWTISLLSGCSPQSLILRPLKGDEWEAKPA